MFEGMHVVHWSKQKTTHMGWFSMIHLVILTSTGEAHSQQNLIQISHKGCIRSTCSLLTVPGQVDQECSYEVEGISEQSRSQANQTECHNLITVHNLPLGSVRMSDRLCGWWRRLRRLLVHSAAHDLAEEPPAAA